MAVIDEIAVERKRQVEQEGWTPAHDDGHDSGEMLIAANIYYHHAVDALAFAVEPTAYTRCEPPVGWPWDRKWWKPKDPRRDLIRAGALAMAEKERLQRAGRTTRHVEHKFKLIGAAIKRLDRAEPVLEISVRP